MQKQARRHEQDPARDGIRKRIGVYALLLGIAATIAAMPAAALPIEATVGTGPDLATVVLEFQDGADFVFEVLFDDAITTTGLDIMETLEAELPSFVLTLQDFGFGVFIDGIAYDGHSDQGFGGGELFWHYWTKEAELDPWVSSQIGAGDRVISDGGYDGWVYGSAAAPIPEPGTAVLVGLGLAGLARFRRQDRRRAQSRSGPGSESVR